MPSRAGKSVATDPLDLEQLTYDDPRVFELFKRADTTGVFQFESGGMRRLLVQMKPDRLEDLIAANALYRPGPMDLIPQYNARKHGQEPVPSVHEIVDRFTAETYGIMVYQEQVMQIASELGGIPLRAAYTLIKAISKKKEKVINENRPRFVEGAVGHGLDKKRAEELFDLILKFAGYGFNKSHSTGYAIVAYRTAYLKTFFPNQYMAAFLTYESQAQKVDDWIGYLDDCKRVVFPDGRIGVDVRPPDVNRSQAEFAVVFDEGEPRDNLHGHVRFGLKAIKGVGSSAIDALVAERDANGPYKSLYDFCERLPPGSINKATIEALIKAGAFDAIHSKEERAAMLASVERAVAAGQSLAKDRAAGQCALFGGSDADEAPPDTPEPALAAVDPWDERETLAHEKQSLGFYVSAHPLDREQPRIERFATHTTGGLKDAPQEGGAIVAAIIKSIRAVTTKKGDHMAILTIEDRLGTADAVAFPKTYASCAADIQTDAIVFVEGTVDHSRGDTQIIIEALTPIERAEQRLATAIELTLDERRLNGTAAPTLDMIRGLLAQQRGTITGDPVPVRFAFVNDESRVIVEPGPACRAIASPDFIGQTREWLGESNVMVLGGKRARSRSNTNRRGPQRRELGTKEMCESVDRV
ncbi:MAG: DNA polymerase III subunit alpha [Planctomycetota bacterium]